MTATPPTHPLLPSDDEGEDGVDIAGAAWRSVGATTGRVSMSGPEIQRLPRGPRVDFTELEDRVQNYLTQAMHADLDHTMLRGTGAPTSFAATASQGRTPRARDDLFDSIRYSFASSEAITEGRVAMWMSLAEAASQVSAPQDASDDTSPTCATLPETHTPVRRKIRVRR